MVTLSKRARENRTKVDPNRRYALEEAVAALKAVRGAKFDETVELAIKLEIDAEQSDQLVRGSFFLPRGTGRQVRVIAFAEGAAAEEARGAGAIEAGGEELVARVQQGWTDFDVAVAHPSMMRNVGKLGRILGPQGKMPSPKSGTVTPDIARAVGEFRAGRVEYRTDKHGNVHVPVGKVSFEPEALVENIGAMIEHIRSVRPAAVKGNYIGKVSLSTTMGPGLQLAV